MKADEVIEKFKSAGALLEGHFILSSGLHSPVYLQCAIALQSTAVAAEFGAAIAEHFRGKRIETVASPAIGGIVIGYEVARQLGVRFIWTEREGGRMTLRRGFGASDGGVLVVEDVITTGGSTRETIEALRDAGANVVAAASIIDRSGGQADVGVPRVSLATLEVAAVDSSVCESCKQGEPATKPGSGTAVGRRQ
ncbi:MAG: orotate phosphoribosyltransferase [Acidobacteria bacterium]|nr:MAG: orotate phosphoribosyltransferase [Acidobacteriota bacterium]